uniref:DNA-directed DNA polymerase n=1 Tax=Trichogramma kaykai TaxID=54128 RepID=A0ABD2W4A6_9HYME
MLLFVEKGIRGGVSQCCSKYAEANNRYMGEDYNPEKEDVYLMYYDVNNLYGWAMAQYLPYGGFEWADAKDYLTLPEDSEYGYILEVDLEYPESLHDLHKDLPLCPEHACPPGSKQRKLLTTLNPKHKYVIHYRSLQQNTITFDDYLQCLRENTIISREQHNIRSRLHVLRSEKERKIALSPHDDKRYLVPGTFDTLPWGHKDIESEPPAKKPKYN